VCEPEITGFLEVLQHTPRAVISAPPLLVMLPPVVAELTVIADTFVVVRTARDFSFLHPLVRRIPNSRLVRIRRFVSFFIP
jgi:hypothetical protein